MTTRDPRHDPRPGDVLRDANGYRTEVVAVHVIARVTGATQVLWRHPDIDGPHCYRREARSRWRRWHRHSEVLVWGTDR